MNITTLLTKYKISLKSAFILLGLCNMQAAGLLKEKNSVVQHEKKSKTTTHRPMAKPVLVASITQEYADTATLIEEASNGMGWITTHVKLPNGKNAWKGANEITKSSRRRIGGKNKVGDSSAVSQFEKSQSQNRQSGGVVNVLLYVGFVLVSLGLIMTFVGMGERGFKTEDLKLIGPSLIGSGILFGFLRILFCSLPKNACSRKKPLDEKSLLSPSQETLGEQPPSPPKPPRKLPPIKNDNANKTEKLFKDKEILETLDTENRCEEIHEMQNNTEDEVESDSDLGLDVDYIQEHKSNKSSRVNSSKSVNTQDENKTDIEKSTKALNFESSHLTEIDNN